MVWSDLDAERIAQVLPEGVSPASTTATTATGVLVGVDALAKLVQVTVGGGDPIWVPAVGAIYKPGGLVRLSRSAVDGGRVVSCDGPLEDGPEIVQGRVSAINASTGTLTVTTLDSSFNLPYVAGTYSVGTVVHVLRSTQRFGAPVVVLGPQGNFAGVDPGGGSGGAGNPGKPVQRQRIILPQWSGSWKASGGRWNSWNTDRYGGPSTLWQGNDYGSGPMTGLATYGDQLVNLGAVTIDEIRVSVYRADASVSAGKVPVLQPSANGSQPPGAPSLGGATVAGPALTPGGGAGVVLPGSVLDGFRTGAYKGLATVGSQYAGFSGTSRGDGMALTVLYTVIE